MEDYLTFEEFEKLSRKEEPKSQTKAKMSYLEAIKRVFRGIWIILKAIGFGFKIIGKGIWKFLLGLEEGMEKMRKSQMGKQLKAHYEQNKKNTPDFMLPKPQKHPIFIVPNSKKSYDFGMEGLRQDFIQKRKKNKTRGYWWE